MKKTTIRNTLNIYLIILILIESIIIFSPYNMASINKYDFLVKLINCVFMGFSQIGLVKLIKMYLRKNKYKYIDLLGMILIALLFSRLLFENIEFVADKNIELIIIVKKFIYQVSNTIKIFIPITIMTRFEMREVSSYTGIIQKYKKPIAYIGMCTIVSILLDDYYLIITIMLICMISILFLKFSQEKKIEN